MPDEREELQRLLEETRARTLALVEPLTEAFCAEQHHPGHSPIVWDLAHVAEFEECWLVRAVRGDRSGRLHDDLDPFRNARRRRGGLPLPDRAACLERLSAVRESALRVLERADLGAGDPLLENGFVHRMVAQHECQHQETLLQTIQVGGPRGGYGLFDDPGPDPERSVDDTERVAVPAARVRLGTDDRTWAYDNERPCVEVEVESFELDRYPVTNRRWREFVADGGYRRAELWSEEGWRWRAESDARHPQYWTSEAGEGVERFGEHTELDPREPVQHVSFHEAQAFCAWAGGRLPSEIEWERAATWDASASVKHHRPWAAASDGAPHANIDHARGAPAPVGSFPDGASPCGAEQMFGDVHEWTASEFEARPGFRAFPYDEYSRPFFASGHRVLRGSSWAARPVLARGTYRNWDLPDRRRLFAGLRVAWSDAAESTALAHA